MLRAKNGTRKEKRAGVWESIGAFRTGNPLERTVAQTSCQPK
jgi:hypothetical protein